MKKIKGFTLIEILIVTSIIALIIIAVFFLAKSQFIKGRDARRKADMHKIQEAVEEYEKDHDCYPLPSLVVCDPGEGLNPYLSKIPCDILTGESFYYESDGSSCSDWYRVYAYLGNEKDEDIVWGIGPDGEYNFYVSSPNAPVLTPGPTSAPTSTPSSQPSYQYYGCVDGVCVGIDWNEEGGPICQPGYDNPNCNNQCGPEAVECR